MSAFEVPGATSDVFVPKVWSRYMASISSFVARWSELPPGGGFPRGLWEPHRGPYRLPARKTVPALQTDEGTLGRCPGNRHQRGGIHYLLERFAQRSAPAYQTIMQRVAAAKVVGADETGTISTFGNEAHAMKPKAHPIAFGVGG